LCLLQIFIIIEKIIPTGICQAGYFYVNAHLLDNFTTATQNSSNFRFHGSWRLRDVSDNDVNSDATKTKIKTWQCKRLWQPGLQNP